MPHNTGSGIDIWNGAGPPAYSSKRFRSVSVPVGRTPLERCGLDTAAESSCKTRPSEDWHEVAHADTSLGLYGTQGDSVGHKVAGHDPLSAAQQRVEFIGNVFVIERSRMRVVPQRR